MLRVGGSSVLLSLPLAYVPDQPEGQDTYVGLYGGAGQAVSVVRGCSGPAFDPLANDFAEVAGVAAVSEEIGQAARVVLSLRGGYFRSRASYPFGASNPPPHQRLAHCGMI